MATDIAETTPRRAQKADTRTRILDAASELFYAQGIRATSADRIIEEVGITKVTFYRHFHTKSDLVVAYLELQAAREKQWMRSVQRDDDPARTLRDLAVGIGDASCRPGFRGCAFINAAAEFSDAQDPVRTAVDAHRAWTLDYFTGIAAKSASGDGSSVARQLMLLRDGAMVNGYLNDPESVARSLGGAFEAIIRSE